MSDGRNRGDTGQFEQKATRRGVFEAMEPSVPYTATEIGEQAGLSRERAGDFLRDLSRSDEFNVIRKEHSKRVITYRRPCDCE